MFASLLKNFIAPNFVLAEKKAQPVSTLYLGAQHFNASSIDQIARQAQDYLQQYAPGPLALAEALQFPEAQSWQRQSARQRAELNQHLVSDDCDPLPEGSDLWLLQRIYRQTELRLSNQPLADLRIDFEDGLGPLTDSAEDAYARQCAQYLAQSSASKYFPPYCGIRIRAFDSHKNAERGLRTLDIFCSELLRANAGKLPPGFAITLPKVEQANQLSLLVQSLDEFERQHQLDSASIALEIMLESSLGLVNEQGAITGKSLLAAGGERLRGVHLGIYDYGASARLAAPSQRLDSRTCEWARNIIKLAFDPSAVTISDGSTNILPEPVYSSGELNSYQHNINALAVHQAWRQSYAHISAALDNGIYQGWELHPGQLPVRYAANARYFLARLPEYRQRLSLLRQSASQLASSGGTFDEPATARGLRHYYQLAYAAGSIDKSDLQEVGLDAGISH